LAYINVVGSILFAGLSGSSIADTAAIGAVLMPPMIKEGYDKHFTIAVTCASGCIGPIIPPSIFMIIYAYLTGQSVIVLFLAGVIPGLLVGGAQIALIYIYTLIPSGNRLIPPSPYKNLQERSFSDTVTILKEGIPAIILPLIIIGGILGGVFTPTEAGAVAVFYGLLIGVFLYKSISFKKFKEVIIVSTNRIAQAALIAASSLVIAWLLSVEKFGQTLADAFLSLSVPPQILMLIIAALLALVTCLVDALATTFILVPILQPLALQIGINELVFAMVVLIMIILGGITPPVAPVLYVANLMVQGNSEKAILATIPFLFFSYLVVIAIIFLPGLVVFLPNLLIK
jgi:C4-dicarboxylate transporter DctM subunit